MPKFHAIHATVQLAVGTVLLALVLRTWLVMGLVEPVVVAGNSMAPALGDGDHLRIDRTTFDRRLPRRGEVVVLRNPHDGLQLCAKRIVGLPGEIVQLAEGDVWIGGQPYVKTLAEQHDVRQLVHREEEKHGRWQADNPNGWRQNNGVWRFDSPQTDRWRWLRYVHPNGEPITDDVETNVGLSRQLNLAQDFSLSAILQARGEGRIALELNDSRQKLKLTLTLPEGRVDLTENDKLLASVLLSTASRRELRRGAVSVELSNFDRQLLLAIGSRVELRHPLADESPVRGTNTPFAVGALGLQISLSELTLYRDIYYLRQPVGMVAEARLAILRLGDDEYYLLGDNSPISIDSRLWGGVSGRLLLGRPLGVR